MSEKEKRRKGPPRPVGYRGNYHHGKPLDDPVYPTKTVPYELLPRYPTDWRTGGRAMLIAGLAVLEGRRLRSRGSILKWQKDGHCSPRCASACSKSPGRYFCAKNVVAGTFQHHVNNMDGLLMMYKGEVPTEKPLFSIKRQVFPQNRYFSEAYQLVDGKYHPFEKEKIHPAFKITEGKLEGGYDSDSDPEASDSDDG
eukprot:GEMP01068623.1.p1 GENE.GEMP01068623.1~~GEMP01068623.1.p1  ORF type:complete len:197 (+),score=37.14 GEMP01068623.1:96-686(+)